MTGAQVRALYEPGSYREVPNDGMRKVVAARLTESKQSVPHFFLTIDVNIDRMIAAFTTNRIAQGKSPVVVMLEAHESTDTYFEGAQLNQVTAWYTSLATRYKDNPYVWFNVGNEPGQMKKPADWPPDQPWDIFLPDKVKWETMHQTVIRAVRDAVGATESSCSIHGS